MEQFGVEVLDALENEMAARLRRWRGADRCGSPRRFHRYSYRRRRRHAQFGRSGREGCVVADSCLRLLAWPRSKYRPGRETPP